MSIVFMFPGQSSRDEGMFLRLRRLAGEETEEVLRRASEVLGRDLGAQYGSEQGVAFESNQDVQLGVFLASHILLQSLARRGVEAGTSLGLSLGEYNHLVHIGALPFEAALVLVDERGRCYDAGPSGMMASVFPVDGEAALEAVERVRDRGLAEVAGYNSPSQQVIGGEAPAVEAAMAILEDEQYAECVIIERSIPMHTSLFRSVAERFRPAVEAAPWQAPERPYVPNAEARLIAHPQPSDFCSLLTAQVWQPVRWRASIDAVAARQGDATFVEVGPRAVLYNLLRRDWQSNPKYRLDAPETSGASLDEIARELAIAA
jgi:[acyl-carrier-protein] S-malonyltransferase